MNITKSKHELNVYIYTPKESNENSTLYNKHYTRWTSQRLNEPEILVYNLLGV